MDINKEYSMAFYIHDKQICKQALKHPQIICEKIFQLCGEKPMIEIRYKNTTDEVLLIQLPVRAMEDGYSNIVMIQPDNICVNPLSTTKSVSHELYTFIQEELPSIVRDCKLLNILNKN